MYIFHVSRTPNVFDCCRHLSGEDILALGMRDLKQLERQLKIGVERVRSRKVGFKHGYTYIIYVGYVGVIVEDEYVPFIYILDTDIEFKYLYIWKVKWR